MKRIASIGGYVLSIFLIVYILISLIIPEQTMNILGFRTFIIVSPSMEPDINTNDMIIITRPKEDKLDVRDAITFSVYIPEVGDRSYVTHYIGAMEDDGNGTTIYKTQDATSDPGDYDEWTDANGDPYDITFDDIEGVYLFRIPWIGNLMTMLRDPLFVGLLLINGTVIYFVFRYIKGILNENKEKTE